MMDSRLTALLRNRPTHQVPGPGPQGIHLIYLVRSRGARSLCLAPLKEVSGITFACGLAAALSRGYSSELAPGGGGEAGRDETWSAQTNMMMVHVCIIDDCTTSLA